MRSTISTRPGRATVARKPPGNTRRRGPRTRANSAGSKTRTLSEGAGYPTGALVSCPDGDHDHAQWGLRIGGRINTWNSRCPGIRVYGETWASWMVMLRDGERK